MSTETKREDQDQALVHMTLHDFEVQLRKAYREGRYDGHSLGEAESLEWVAEDWRKSNTKARLDAVRSEIPEQPPAMDTKSRCGLVLQDSSLWPHPDACGEVAWQLRYGKPSRADMLLAASGLGAYIELCVRPDMAKKLPWIRSALRKLAGMPDKSLANPPTEM